MKKMNHRFGDTVTIYEGAKISENVKIGPFTIIFPNVVMGDGVHIGSSSIIGKPPSVGKNQTQLIGVRDTTLIEKSTSVGDHVIVYKGAQIGSGSYLADKSFIRENVKLCSGVVVGTAAVVSFNSYVGPNTKIMTYTNISGNMKIGADCFIGVHVCFVNDNEPRKMKPRKDQEGGTLGDRVMIGSNATVLPALKIADDVTVGAGSVVTKSLSTESGLYFGSPARLIE